MSGVLVERRIHFGRLPSSPRGGRRTVIRAGPAPAPIEQSAPRPLRVAKLMALALRCDHLIRSGAVHDATDLAVIAHVSQPRMTQILNLTLLAPDIQEELLFLDEDRAGSLGEHHLRAITRLVRWDKQRVAWRRLLKVGACSSSIDKDLD
jgi:hypothetical protein